MQPIGGKRIRGALVPSLGATMPGLPDITAAELDRLADDLDRNSIAINTRRSYLSDWASWLSVLRAPSVQSAPGGGGRCAPLSDAVGSGRRAQGREA